MAVYALIDQISPLVQSGEASADLALALEHARAALRRAARVLEHRTRHAWQRYYTAAVRREADRNERWKRYRHREEVAMALFHREMEKQSAALERAWQAWWTATYK